MTSTLDELRRATGPDSRVQLAVLRSVNQIQHALKNHGLTVVINLEGKFGVEPLAEDDDREECGAQAIPLEAQASQAEGSCYERDDQCGHTRRQRSNGCQSGAPVPLIRTGDRGVGGDAGQNRHAVVALKGQAGIMLGRGNAVGRAENHHRVLGIERVDEQRATLAGLFDGILSGRHLLAADGEFKWN